ncbi:hypothetical protein [Helicobacter marmotae]|nr:hypothetical protein [Helicobacter marmotae]
MANVLAIPLCLTSLSIFAPNQRIASPKLGKKVAQKYKYIKIHIVI